MAINRKPIANPRRIFSVVGYTLATMVLAYLFGFGYFVKATHDMTVDKTTYTDAVVVLTGGSGRIAAAVSLLQAGTAKRLFISGVNPETDASELARLNGQSAALFKCCVVVGHHAANTIGNAAESAEWIRNGNYRSLRLVTVNYHLPRALLEFRMALPAVEIIPNPIDAHPSPGLHIRFILEYTKYLVTLARFEFFELAHRVES